MTGKPRRILISLIVLCAAAGFMTLSCIDSETRIGVNADGSGIVDLSYTVSPLVMNIGRLDEDDPLLPLPVSEEDFVRTAAEIPDLELRDYTVREDEDGIHIAAELAFGSSDALDEFIDTGEGGFSLSDEGGVTRFRYVIYTASEEDPAEESITLVRDFFSESFLRFSLETPGIVQSASTGTISEDRRTVNLELNTADLIADNNNVIWEVTW